MVLYFDCRLKYLRKYLNHHLDVMSEISSVKGVKRMDAPTKGSKTLGLKWLIAFAVPIALCFIPMSSDVTPEIRRFLVVTVWAILMFMFELRDTAIVSLAMIFGYILFQVVPIETALSAWMNTTVWMAIASFIIVNVVQKTKLLERLAYSLVIMTGGSYMGILFGIAIMSIVFCLLVPSTVTSMIVMAIAYGLCRALKLEVGKASAGIMLTSIICFVEATNFLYVPQCIGLSASVVGVSVDYFTILKHNWVFIPLLFLMAFVIGIVFKPEHPIGGREIFIEKKAALGSMDRDEKKTLAVLIAMVIYLFTVPWHGFDMVYGFIFGTVLLFIPHVGVGSSEDIEKVNMGTIIFFVSCMAIGSVGGAVGIGDLLAKISVPLLEGQSIYVFSALIWIIGVICNFFMTPLALMTILGGPFGTIAANLGISGYPVAYLLSFAGNNLLFPYENTLFLICFIFGMVKMKDFIKIGAIKMVICLAYTLIIGVTYWNIIGLF